MSQFGLRACAVITDVGRVLLQQGDGEDFWALPGGHVEIGELSQEALIRELREELDTTVEVLGLLWVVENLFRYNGSLCHELGLYYRVRAPNLPAQEAFRGREPHLLFRWFELPTLGSVDVRPAPLGRKLQAVGPGIEHLQWRSA